MPKERWPGHDEALAYIQKHWHEPFGDRRQELVFIGSGMDRAAITHALDSALVDGQTDYDPARWQHLADPFPHWRRAGGAS